LFALARRLQLTFPLVLSAVTKADRGFALAVGADMTLAPRRFRRTELTADMSAGQAFAVAARAAVEQIVWNATLVSKAPSPEAIHQTRVGVRRLRATLSTFKDVVSDDERRRLATRLKALGRDLDEARNLDVFIDGVWRRTPAALRPDADETALIDAKSAAYGRARTAMENGDARTLTLDVLAWIETGPWTYARASGAKTRDRPVTRFAEGSLRRGRRKLLEAGGSLATLTPAARHHVRIRTKVLRYACEVLAPVFPKHPGRASRFLLALETLAETLGDLNDLATARTVVSQLPASITLPADGGHREGKLIAAAEKAFRQLKEARPFWPDET
jgi:CHAD domain-containing protein